MTHLSAGRHRSFMARPMRPSMLLGVTRLHAAIATSTGRIARSLLFTTASSHVKIFSVNSARGRGTDGVFPSNLSSRRNARKLSSALVLEIIRKGRIDRIGRGGSIGKSNRRDYHLAGRVCSRPRSMSTNGISREAPNIRVRHSSPSVATALR